MNFMPNIPAFVSFPSSSFTSLCPLSVDHPFLSPFSFLFLPIVYYPSLPSSPLTPSHLSPPLPNLSSPLHTDQASLTRQLQSLPLRSDTLKHKLKRAELETKLAEIDDALKIFSRPKVFVKTDD